MQFVIRKNELLQAMQQVSRAVPSRTPKPILYGIRIVAQNGRLYITAYDLEFGIQQYIESPLDEQQDVLQIQREGSIVLQARYFIDIVRKLPHSLVRVDVQDLTATIRSGTATYTLNGMDPMEYPDLPIVHDDRGFAIPANTLQSLIEHTAFAVAASESRPTLTGILWQYADGRLKLTATDSHRLSTETCEVESHRDYALMDSIIPGKSLMELSRILPDNDSMINIMIANNQLLVAYANTHFHTRLIEGSFPDTSRIIPTMTRTSIVISTATFQDCIERSALLARDIDNNIVRLNLRRTNLEITSHSPEIGKVTETVDPITFEGEDLLIACNAKYLLEALRQVPTENVRVDFTGLGSSFVLRPVGLPQLLHLILPVRIANI